MPPAPNPSRALSSILPLISSGQSYEAHQKARTFASRYAKVSQHAAAADVLFETARELLKGGWQGSGADLAGFFIEVVDGGGFEVVQVRDRLTQLIALTGPGGSWRKTIIDKAVAWSAKHGPCPAGDPDLNHYIGELLYKEGAFLDAEPHLLAAGLRDSARVLAHMMFEWSSSTSGQLGPGVFALRVVIPYLQNGNILAARTFLSTYLALHLSSPSASPLLSPHSPEPIPIPHKSPSDEDKVTLTTDPALNFAQLTVATCQRAQGEKSKTMREAWIRLIGTYGARGGVLAQHEVRAALQDISTLYFAIPPPRNQAANPFGDMMSSLFGGPPPQAAAGAQRRALAPATASDLD